MLSPPYSPFPEKESGALAASTATSTSDRSRISRAPDATPTQSDSATAVSSMSASGDDITDNDYSSEESSGSVPPEAVGRDGGSKPSGSRKRAASEAFVDEETQSRTHSLRQRRMTTCWDALKSDPARYLRQERSLLGMYPLRRHSWAGPTSNTGAIGDESPEAANGANTTRGRGRRAHRTVSGSGNGSAAGTPSRRGRRAALQAESDGGEDASEEQSPKKATQVRVHDLNLSQIEDFSPPLSTLPPGKSLRAEWKGAPMDLSNDPDLHLLHPAEAHLASVLRLPCEVYLDSKRRLFAEKVHRMRQGLPFRRTDSQKACRIDVNKASRLFGAFERIGWLDDALFLNHLEQ